MADILLPMVGGGGGASDECTATRSRVLAGYKAVTADSNDEPAEGLIPSMGGQTVIPTNVAKTVACNGKYMTGDITVPAVSNLVPGYIKAGVVVGGVTGTMPDYSYLAQGQTAF